MPRKTAYKVLLSIEKEGAYSNIKKEEIFKNSALEDRDKRLSSNIIDGVTERKITLDYNISLYLSQPIKKLKKDVLTCLRIGVYQIFFLNKVPDSAAVNESVKLSKKFHFSYASGMINAVLRKCSVNGLVIPEDDLSVRYSCPRELIDFLVSDYGEEDTKAVLQSFFEPKRPVIRVNTLKTNEDELIDLLKKDGIIAEKTDIENALEISTVEKSPVVTKAYKNGLFHLQGLASQICAKSLDAKENNIVLDMCAAPGGKTFTISQEMKNSGRVLAFDIHPHRVELIKKGAKRLGIDIIKAATGDAAVFDEKIGFADRILCDVPCSGLGTIGSKPEIKYKDINEFCELTLIQSKILETASQYLKTGGKIVYSTCTLNKNENEGIVESFLLNHKNFVLESMKTFLPHKDNCDGFFVSVMVKNG